MILETLRLDKRGKELLVKVKRYTKLQNWNSVSRWAFCVSLNEDNIPPKIEFKNRDQGVEMTWKIFAGENTEIYLALLKQRLIEDNIELTEDNLRDYFYRHLYRGLGYLSSKKKLIDFF